MSDPFCWCKRAKITHTQKKAKNWKCITVHRKHQISRPCTYKVRNSGSWQGTKTLQILKCGCFADIFNRAAQEIDPVHTVVKLPSPIQCLTEPRAVGRRSPALVVNIGSKKYFRIWQHRDVSVNLRFGHKMSWHFILRDILWNSVIIRAWIYDDVWPAPQ